MNNLDNVSDGQQRFEETTSTSPSLIQQLKSKQTDAWQRMAMLYGPVVLHWCRRARIQDADADDIVQEVFRTVAQKIDAFRHDTQQHTFRGWLWKITRNKIGDFMRRQKTSAQPIGGTEGQLRMTDVPFDESSLDELTEDGFGGLYQRALDLIRVEFQPKSWTAFWQVVIEGRSAINVAAELDLSPNAVYIAKSRVLSRLREELGDL